MAKQDKKATRKVAIEAEATKRVTKADSATTVAEAEPKVEVTEVTETQVSAPAETNSEAAPAAKEKQVPLKNLRQKAKKAGMPTYKTATREELDFFLSPVPEEKKKIVEKAAPAAETTEILSATDETTDEVVEEAEKIVAETETPVSETAISIDEIQDRLAGKGEPVTVEELMKLKESDLRDLAKTAAGIDKHNTGTIEMVAKAILDSTAPLRTDGALELTDEEVLAKAGIAEPEVVTEPIVLKTIDDLTPEIKEALGDHLPKVIKMLTEGKEVKLINDEIVEETESFNPRACTECGTSIPDEATIPKKGSFRCPGCGGQIYICPTNKGGCGKIASVGELPTNGCPHCHYGTPKDKKTSAPKLEEKKVKDSAPTDTETKKPVAESVPTDAVDNSFIGCIRKFVVIRSQDPSKDGGTITIQIPEGWKVAKEELPQKLQKLLGTEKWIPVGELVAAHVRYGEYPTLGGYFMESNPDYDPTKEAGNQNRKLIRHWVRQYWVDSGLPVFYKDTGNEVTDETAIKIWMSSGYVLENESHGQKWTNLEQLCAGFGIDFKTVKTDWQEPRRQTVIPPRKPKAKSAEQALSGILGNTQSEPATSATTEDKVDAPTETTKSKPANQFADEKCSACKKEPSLRSVPEMGVRSALGPKCFAQGQAAVAAETAERKIKAGFSREELEEWRQMVAEKKRKQQEKEATTMAGDGKSTEKQPEPVRKVEAPAPTGITAEEEAIKALKSAGISPDSAKEIVQLARKVEQASRKNIPVEAALVVPIIGQTTLKQDTAWLEAVAKGEI